MKQVKNRVNSSLYYNYLKRGIILDKSKGCNTFNIIEWYELILQGKASRFPKQVINNVAIVELFKYVIEVKLNIKTREEIKMLSIEHLHKQKIYFKPFNLPKELHKVINIIYPEYNLQPWEMHMTGIKIFKDENNIIKAIDWLLQQNNLDIEKIKNVNKYITCTVDEMFQTYGLSCLLSSRYFNGYQNLFLWYFNKKGYNMSIHDFEYKTNNYWASSTNANFQMRKYIKSLFLDGLINNVKIDLPQYFSKSFLETTKYIMLYVCLNRYKHFKNFYEWIKYLYPKLDITEKDFSIYIGVDGSSQFDSLQEKQVFDFIYINYKLDIKHVGKKYKFYNDKYNENYIPDYIIKFNKRLIFIEYYGLFVTNKDCKMILNYVKKTYRKNDYYNSNKDIHFIDLYPEDLKNNFEGVRNKLTSFFMLNFNIDINERKVGEK